MSFIVHKHKFVFVHIPKTAGKSIEMVFRSNCQKQKVLRHTKLSQIYNQHNEIKNYKSITCVRDPWNRQYSMYLYLIQRATMKKQTQKLTLLNKGFENYLTSDYYEHDDHKKDWFHHLYTNQIEWIDNDIKNVDFLLKFETLVDDWTKLVDALKLPYVRHSLPKINTSQQLPDYKNFYNLQTKRIIEKRFERDIDTFKYTF